MENVRDALLRMYRASKTAKKFDDVFCDYDTPYTDIYGDIADAIYYLIGEDTGLFSDSVTYSVLHTENMTESRAVAILLAEYGRNNCEQPKPTTFEKDETKKLFEENGGYATPEGEWK